VFAIKERVGKPEHFIGRIREIEFLYQWADNIRNELSRSIAFLGRRKIGKSLIMERLYNIIGNKGDVYDFMLFSDSFYFLQENFNVWIGEKHKIIDVPFPPP